ncbi:helix-turn-helix domain-containing protein (plasmid) [Arthrobacter agilis]|uniref:helix-turn-helix domain-containing protein n=1 Tax=Arthrobacter agilis TaxID=37921 RepID=UPI002366253F|nr:helix-turn-helix domain-containing protein [Arthrobacter agilis]WDF35265.1 helix-turn-helix domain-containing protein [Arthrobacter agilis]
MSKALDRMFASLPERLSIDQLTDLLGLSNRTVTYKWLREGNIPAMKLGGTWLILRDDVREHLEASYNIPRPSTTDENTAIDPTAVETTAAQTTAAQNTDDAPPGTT